MTPTSFKALCASTGLNNAQLAAVTGVHATQLKRWQDGYNPTTGKPTVAPQAAVTMVLLLRVLLNSGVGVDDIKKITAPNL